MIEKDNYAIVGTLTYGRLLNKRQKNLFIFLIILSVSLILLGVSAAIFFNEIIFLIFDLLFTAIFVLISFLELNMDSKNKKLIGSAVNDAVLLKATTKTVVADTKSNVKLSVSFRYHDRRITLCSPKYIRIGANYKNTEIQILYSEAFNCVLFLDVT